ncbi:hypothetical protein D3C83_199230 [compost metagenome]
MRVISPVTTSTIGGRAYLSTASGLSVCVRAILTSPGPSACQPHVRAALKLKDLSKSIFTSTRAETA